MQHKFLVTGAVFGFLAVVTGAFAAHGLKPLLERTAIDSFETGVRYQMYHALLLLLLGGFRIIKPKYEKVVYYLLLSGIIFFSGSIYALSTSGISGVDFSPIALVTPLGGLLLITAWAVLGIGFYKVKKEIK